MQLAVEGVDLLVVVRDLQEEVLDLLEQEEVQPIMEVRGVPQHQQQVEIVLLIIGNLQGKR